MVENEWGFKEYEHVGFNDVGWFREYAIQETGEGQDISDATAYGIKSMICDGEEDPSTDWQSSLWLVPVHSEKMADFIEFATAGERPEVGKTVILVTGEMDDDETNDPFGNSNTYVYASLDEFRQSILTYREYVTGKGDEVLGKIESELTEMEITKTKEDKI